MVILAAAGFFNREIPSNPEGTFKRKPNAGWVTNGHDSCSEESGIAAPSCRKGFHPKCCNCGDIGKPGFSAVACPKGMRFSSYPEAVV